MAKVKYYTFLGFPKDEPWTYAERGIVMVLVIFTFPIWVWAYLIWLIFDHIGRMCPKQKQHEYEHQEEKCYY